MEQKGLFSSSFQFNISVIAKWLRRKNGGRRKEHVLHLVCELYWIVYILELE